MGRPVTDQGLAFGDIVTMTYDVELRVMALAPDHASAYPDREIWLGLVLHDPKWSWPQGKVVTFTPKMAGYQVVCRASELIEPTYVRILPIEAWPV